MNLPLVSVCCITYNHKDYISDAMVGFLLQKTTFPVEIIIYDDASTDGTAELVADFACKFPLRITPILQKENKYSQGIRPSPTFVWPRARGKYIALCEGDDYWTDPYKLQKQVDFLEANPDCSLCFHASKHVWAKNPEKYKVHRPAKIPGNNRFQMKDVIHGGGGFMTTNSMVFLRQYIENLPELMYRSPAGDLSLMLFLASKGEVGYIDEVMSVYRVLVPNSWSARKSTYSFGTRQKLICSTIVFYWHFNVHTKYQYVFHLIAKILKLASRIPVVAIYTILRKDVDAGLSAL